MPVFHVNHKLADFDKWFAVFKEGNPRKDREAQYGVKSLRVLRDADDGNHAVVVMEADSRSAIDQMTDDPQVQERFADTSLFAEPPSVLAGYEPIGDENVPEGGNSAFLVDQGLADFDKWNENWTANEAQRQELYDKHDVKVVRVLRDIDNRNRVVVAMSAPSRSALEGMWAEPAPQAAFSDSEIFQRPPKILGQFTRTDI
jgi:hypothetical protein